MDLRTVLNILVVAFYAATTLIVFILGPVVLWHEFRVRRVLKSNIARQVAAGVNVTAATARMSARGAGLPAAAASRAVHALLLQTTDPDLFEKLKSLAEQLEKEAPFSELPEEVKPSLYRLTELCDASTVRSDQHLLSPIQRTLSSYVDLSNSYARSKKFNLFFNIIGLISFIVGAYALFLSPSLSDIEATVTKALSQPPAKAAESN